MADNPLHGLLGEALTRATEQVRDRLGLPYIWGTPGPGPLTVQRVSAMVPVSDQQAADAQDFLDAIAGRSRFLAELREWFRELELTDGREAAFRHRRAWAMHVTAVAVAAHRAYEAERCPCCGCHPAEHGDD